MSNNIKTTAPSLSGFTRLQRANSSAGFTLIEIMIVLSIVCILCLIAVPNFESLLFKARRLDGEVGLYQLQNQALIDPDDLPTESPLSYYKLVEQDRVAEAQPQKAQAFDPEGVLTLKTPPSTLIFTPPG